MKVAIVGGGPAGSLLAFHLARDGAAVTVYDPSHPREKPCGGGLTGKAVKLLPPAPAADPLPVRWIDRCTFDAASGASLEVALDTPVAVAARLELDSWLLRRAVEAGAQHLPERVLEARADGTLRTASGTRSVDVIVGADGAGSLVRRQILGGPVPKARLHMAVGWYAPGDAPMLVRFLPGLAGYLWLFPRRDHVGVGIAAPLGAIPSRELFTRLEAEVARHYPALLELDPEQRYAHIIASPGTDEAPLREISGDHFALVGDAGALADPLTGEGLYYALASARLLAETLRDTASPRTYAQRVIDGFGRELRLAARLQHRFYAPGFSTRMIDYARRSPAIRRVVSDLVLGDQGYVGLKRRLIRTLPSFLVDSALARLRAA